MKTLYQNNKYLIFFSQNEFTKGYTKTSIADIRRGRLLIANNDVYDFMKNNDRKEISDIYSDYECDCQDIVKSYIDYFLENDLAFIGSSEDIKLFKDFQIYWDTPSVISNLVIEHSKNNFDNMDLILSKIKCLQVHAIQYISFFDHLDYTQITQLSNLFFERENVSPISFIIKYNPELEYELLPTKIKQSCFFELFIHSAPKNTHPKNYITYVEEQIISYSQCGNVSKGTFSINKEHFNESHIYNSCLNRKMAIDKNGNIKNCLSMDKIFGNIFEDDVKQIVNSLDFIHLWHITKDQIEVCKDCEFRYICTDCRCFIQNPNNIYSKPAKCGYNPYIAKWLHEDGYVPVEECGSYSEATGFVPDKGKINRINNEIWK
ncbi:hypothetical protein FACS1894178_4470 [Bacteroidia bacterium]|nr:hypothetical protein FACS1894178_4470 [Bacteroidia bacterium]